MKNLYQVESIIDDGNFYSYTITCNNKVYSACKVSKEIDLENLTKKIIKTVDRLNNNKTRGYKDLPLLLKG